MVCSHEGDEPARPSRYRGVFCAMLAALMMGACAPSESPPQVSLMGHAEAPRSETGKSIAHWHQEYSKSPRDKNAVLGYARKLKASGQKQAAMAVLQRASLYHVNDPEFASEFGRLALEFDQILLAERLLAIADDPMKPDWRVVSAQGTVLAKRGDYRGAIAYYERALQLAPNQPSVMNNLAMALAAEGQTERAEHLLRRALEDPTANPKVRQNLVVVLGLQGKYDEAKVAGLSDRNTDSNIDYLRRMGRVEREKSDGLIADTRPVAMDMRSGSHGLEDGWVTRVAEAAPVAPLRPSKR